MRNRNLQFVSFAALAGMLAGCLSGTPTRPDGTASPQQRIAELESRVQRLENQVESGQLLELMQRVETLHTELRELRGDGEQRGHEVESLSRRQRELYLDLDRRLQNLETGGRAPAAAAPAESRAEPRQSAVERLERPSEDGQRTRYESAFRLLQEGRYPAAIDAFQQFLADFPEGPYSDNAQYWLGEAYYVTRDYRSARAEFGKVVERHPDSQKIPDAKLKIGYVHYELQEWEDARRVLTEVAGMAPGSTIARLAEQRLQRMRQEGR